MAGADARAVDVEPRPIDTAKFVDLQVQRFEDAIKNPFARPAVVTIKDTLEVSVARRHVAPRRAAVEHLEHAVEGGAVVVPSPAGSSCFWHERLDPSPRRVGQVVTSHPCVSWGEATSSGFTPRSAKAGQAPSKRVVGQNLMGGLVCITSTSIGPWGILTRDRAQTDKLTNWLD